MYVLFWSLPFHSHCTKYHTRLIPEPEARLSDVTRRCTIVTVAPPTISTVGNTSGWNLRVPMWIRITTVWFVANRDAHKQHTACLSTNEKNTNGLKRYDKKYSSTMYNSRPPLPILPRRQNMINRISRRRHNKGHMRAYQRRVIHSRLYYTKHDSSLVPLGRYSELNSEVVVC